MQHRPDRTLGPPHDEFWNWCGRGELRLQRCDDCARLSWPPVLMCEHCGGHGLVWKRLSGRGRIISWCSFEQDYYRACLPLPWDTILVELEEGALMISNPAGFSWREIEPDMAVRLTFIDCADSGGVFRLPVFARA